MEILDCVTITPELTENFAPFIPVPLVEGLRRGTVLGLGSLLGDVPDGALVFDVEGNAAHILCLYVDQYDRGKGTGRFLVENLRGILGKVQGIYSVRAVLPEEDPGVAAFFETLGARVETVVNAITRFPLSAIEAGVLLKAPVSPRCVPGTKLDRVALSHFWRTLKKEGTDLMEEELWETAVRQDFSWYYVKDREIQGCAVMTQTRTGLSLSMLVNLGGAEVLPMLLGALLRRLTETCPPETEISLEAAAPETRKLLKRLVPTAKTGTCRVAVLTV